jgi:hypothetical protein
MTPQTTTAPTKGPVTKAEALEAVDHLLETVRKLAARCAPSRARRPRRSPLDPVAPPATPIEPPTNRRSITDV